MWLRWRCLLCKELEKTGQVAKALGLRLETVYFGGGTPTTLSALQLSRLFDVIEKNFDLSTLREYTVEAGRPDTVTEDKLMALKGVPLMTFLVCASSLARVSLSADSLRISSMILASSVLPLQFFIEQTVPWLRSLVEHI